MPQPDLGLLLGPSVSPKKVHDGSLNVLNQASCHVIGNQNGAVPCFRYSASNRLVYLVHHIYKYIVSFSSVRGAPLFCMSSL